MTKQEEIKEQLLEFANENYVLRPTGVSYQECMVDDMLNYLHSQGVVIKVDRELPEPYDHTEGAHWLNLNCPACLVGDYKHYLDKAGCVAVEPLIKEVSSG